MRRLSLLLLPLCLLLACSSGAPESGFAVESVDLDQGTPSEAFVPNLSGPLRPIAATPNGPMAALPPRATVSITFSRPVVALGDTPEPPAGALRLDPEVPGALRWEGTQTLVFTPATPLPNATAFTATVSGITALDGEVLAEPYAWTFETPRPRLVSSDPADGADLVSPRTTVRLVFNQPIDLASARRTIGFRTADERRIGFDLAFAPEGDSVLVLAPNTGLQKGVAYRVDVMAGLQGTAGPLRLEEPQMHGFETYGDLALLEVDQPRGWYDDASAPLNPERGVTLRFSTPVEYEALRTAVTFTPAAPLEPGAEARDGAVSTSHHLPVTLAPETNYTVTVRALRDEFGQTLASVTRSFRTGPLPPSVRMPTGLLVVEASGVGAIPLRATNVASVRLGARALSANEVVPALRGYDGRYYGDEVSQQDVPLTRTLDLSGSRNEARVEPLRFDSLLTGGTGVVAVHALAPRLAGQSEGQRFRALAQMTNLGLSVKFSPHQNLVFVTDLASATPVAGAQVQIRDAANTVRWRGTTDAKGQALSPGWAELGIEKTDQWDAPLQVAVVQRAGDLAFATSQTEGGLEPWRFGVNYDWNPEAATAAGTVFSDRGLYRTGETVHLKAILRTRTDGDWQAYRDSVRVRITSPRDEDVYDRRHVPSALGTFHFDWTAPPAAAQGVYRLRVSDPALPEEEDYYWLPGLAEGTFRVDAFRTATFDVNTTSAAPAYVAGDFFEGAVEGRYLFGATMGGQPVRYTLARRDASFRPSGYDAFRFGPLSYAYDDYYGLYQQLASDETALDPEGRLAVRHQLPGNPLGEPADVVLEASVTDPARQEMSGRVTAMLHPALFYVGLRSETTFLSLAEDNALWVDVATVDPAGVPVGGKEVTVELIREQWTSVREVGGDGRLRWRSERTEEVVREQAVRSVAGKAQRLTIPVKEGGRYLIRATGFDVRGNRVRTDAYFYATGRGYTAWQREDDDRIELVAARTQYAPGETARILVQNPYETATALVTVEREGILSSRVVTLEGSAPEIEIPLTEAHLPNVFVSVMLLHGRSAAPTATADVGAPSFKIGYVELNVDAGRRHLTVDVEPGRGAYRPGEEVTVRLRLRDERGRGVAGEIAFAAADAGVLNLIDYRLPDPFLTFYGPRPLGVTTTETRARLVEQRNFGDKTEDVGGGGGVSSDMLRKDFRPLAHWAPALKTDGDGRVTVRFRVPESLTTFRLMATALTANHAFGNGSRDIVVTQPLVLQPALPRFARLNDVFEAGVLVTNTTGAAGTATVTAEADGLALDGETQKSVALRDGETKEVRFGWRVPTAATATLRFTAVLGNERDAFEVPLPVALPTTRLVTATFASTDSLAQEALAPPANRLPGLGRFDVRLASTALVGLDGAAEYLFGYPYGCLEQKTSRIRPLLLGDDLLEAFDLDALKGGDRKAVIQAWLDELPSFWTGDGFTLWPGSSYTHPYVSAYVVLALAEAKAAGFTAPNDLAAQAAAALARQVRRGSDKPTYYSRQAWSDSRALMLYALARHGQTVASEIATLAEGPLVDLSVEGVAHLLRAVLASGDPALARFRAPLVNRLRGQLQIESTTAYVRLADPDDLGWIFASDTRATAHALTALAEANPADFRLVAERLTRYLMQQRDGGHWASTQENAAVIDAFRAFADRYETAAPNFTATVRLAGRDVLSQAFRGRSLAVAEQSVPLADLPGTQQRTVSVQKTGTGRVYYSLRLDAYSAAPQPVLSQGLTVRRTLQRLDTGGQPTGSALTTGGGTVTLRPGELVRVTLRVTSPTGRNYVVVDDALPAGLEALNAAFDTTSDEIQRNADSGSGQWWGSFNHTEIQNDRVLLFADWLRAGEHTYTYVARATTPGTFVHPPATAEMMYQPETRGNTATGTLVVEGQER